MLVLFSPDACIRVEHYQNHPRCIRNNVEIRNFTLPLVDKLKFIYRKELCAEYVCSFDQLLEYSDSRHHLLQKAIEQRNQPVL